MDIVVPLIKTSVYQGRTTPESGKIVGYGAIIENLKLPIPFPHILSLITEKSKKYNNEDWKVFPASYEPEKTLYRQLIFAIKYEGINLLVFKALFNAITKDQVHALLHIEPSGIYSRKIWFLYEWLQQDEITVEVDLKKRK
ncbi:MAG: cell filamentation protein Fic, partial [Bizionia sp.]|nr:cell filamentation protein Fic [Bizionia sp.]